MKRIPFPLFAVVLLALLLPPGMAGLSAQAAMLSIRSNGSDLRSGPGTKYRSLWVLDQGFPLQVLKRSGDWYRVRDFEGSVGWVHQDAVDQTPHMIVKVNKNSAKQVNLRSGPGPKYRIVAKANYGVVLMTLAKKNGWVQVQHAQGATGWLRKDLLWGW